MKICVRCEKEKNESEFYPKDSSCKVCRKAQKKGKVVVEPMELIAETHIQNGDDISHNYDDTEFWTIETYSKVVSDYMIKLGAKRIESPIDGWLFSVDAKQLIYFIAKVSKLPKPKF